MTTHEHVHEKKSHSRWDALTMGMLAAVLLVAVFMPVFLALAFEVRALA